MTTATAPARTSSQQARRPAASSLSLRGVKRHTARPTPSLRSSRRTASTASRRPDRIERSPRLPIPVTTETMRPHARRLGRLNAFACRAAASVLNASTRQSRPSRNSSSHQTRETPIPLSASA